MFIVMVYVHDIAKPFGLRFKEEAEGAACFEAIRGTPFHLDGKPSEVEAGDAYGQKVVVLRQNIRALHLMPVEEDLKAQGDLQILVARTNAKVQSMAQHDPVLNLHRAGPGGLIRAS